MNSVAVIVALFVVFGFVLGIIAFLAYRRTLRHAKGIERGLKMVPLLIHLPPPSDDTELGSRSVQEVMREKVNQAQVLYDLVAGTAQGGFRSRFYGQRHLAFEIVASHGLVHYFAAVPIALVEVVEQAIVTAYPGARVEEVEDHNIFNPHGRLTATVGGELVLKHEAAYPIGTIDTMERDPMAALINSLYKLQQGDGAAVQIMLRPANPGWVKRSIKLVAKKRHSKTGGSIGFGVTDLAKAAVKAPEGQQEGVKYEPSKLEEQMLQAIEEKTKHPGYEVLVRVLASSTAYDRAKLIERNMVNAFALFEAPGSNGFQFIEGRDIQGLVTAFIFRFFPPELTSTVLNSSELATLFHLPDSQFTATNQVERQQSKQVDGPVNMPTAGSLLGYNFYRGVKKEVRLSPEDRRRHAYIVGQTGTGKTTMLENLAVQDMLAGNGFAFIDPHGDVAEKLLSMVPKARAEDVIYFNPADLDHPLGLNMFEFTSPDQKDFLIQESLNMLYKLYDPGHTGIMGPRFEHWYRNAALTLMADPAGGTFIELPKVFTDATYLKNKFRYLSDPSVIDFWTKEMGQTSDYHKSEMLGWFVSKFGAFQSNDLMRNIIGQTHSSFNFRDIMDNKKILIVNLSKGRVGELNSQLLGMVFVIKLQAAAMSRADIPEEQRADFSLYVDEFQNFSTDSFATILSEARKFRLNLIVANQYIGQLTDEIRNAVFGNVGSMISYRTGPEDAELLAKQFEPVFDQRDLANLPNYNAVMKLLIAGLPSQPFSMAALPPLGVAHSEMGLAVQQLSAAKFGTSRATVEADIFARLQNQPAPSSRPPAPAAPPVPASPAPQPAAAPVPPPAASSPPPPADHAALLPTASAAPAAPPVPLAPAQPSPASPIAGAATAPASPPPPPPKPAAPKAPGEGGIADVVKAVIPDKPAAPPQVRIEAHETDGRPAATPPPLQIEAHEADGRTSVPVAPPQPAVASPAPPPPQPQVTAPPVPAPQPPTPAPKPPSPTPAPVVPPQPRPQPRPQPLPPPPPPRPVQPRPQAVKPASAPSVQPKPAPQPQPRPTPLLAPTPAPNPNPKPKAPQPPQDPDMPAIPPELADIVKLAPDAPHIPHKEAPRRVEPRPQPKPQPQPTPKPSTPPPSPRPPEQRPQVVKPAPAPLVQAKPVEEVKLPRPAHTQPSEGFALPPDPMESAHIQMHHQGRAAEDPASPQAQQQLAGESSPEPATPEPQAVSSSSRPTVASATEAYVEAAKPKPPAPLPPPEALEQTIPDAPIPHPGEVIAPHQRAAQSAPPVKPTPTPAPAPEPRPAQSHRAPSPKPPQPQQQPKHQDHDRPRHVPKQPRPQSAPKPQSAPEPAPVASQPASKPQPAPMPTPLETPASSEPTKPQLQPGEIFVDENGEVVQG